MSKKAIIELVLKGFDGEANEDDYHIITVEVPPSTDAQWQLKTLRSTLHDCDVLDDVEEMSLIYLNPEKQNADFSVPKDLDSLIGKIKKVCQ